MACRENRRENDQPPNGNKLPPPKPLWSWHWSSRCSAFYLFNKKDNASYWEHGVPSELLLEESRPRPTAELIIDNVIITAPLLDPDRRPRKMFKNEIKKEEPNADQPEALTSNLPVERTADKATDIQGEQSESVQSVTASTSPMVKSETNVMTSNVDATVGSRSKRRRKVRPKPIVIIKKEEGSASPVVVSPNEPVIKTEPTEEVWIDDEPKLPLPENALCDILMQINEAASENDPSMVTNIYERFLDMYELEERKKAFLDSSVDALRQKAILNHWEPVRRTQKRHLPENYWEPIERLWAEVDDDVVEQMMLDGLRDKNNNGYIKEEGFYESVVYYDEDEEIDLTSDCPL